MLPGKLLKKPALIGGVLIMAMVVGGLLSNLFQGFGPGGDPGGGVRVPAPDADDPDDHAAEPPEEPPTPEPSPPPDVVEVVIVEQSYALRQTIDGREERIPVELPELIELARAAPGNEDGVRVRVYRHRTSRAITEQVLEQSLRDAGLDDNEVFWVWELVQ